MKQHEKIIALMIRRYGQQTWFYPPDFQKPGLEELFVGYEASARFSELAKRYPEMLASKNEGKYIYRRFRFENLPAIIHTAPEFVSLIVNEFSSKGLSMEKVAKDAVSAPLF